MSMALLMMLYNNASDDDFYRNLAFQVLKNITAVPRVSSYQLAELCYASPSAILRLARKLGHSSYSDFKASVGWWLDRRGELSRNLPLEIPTKQGALTAVLNGLDNIAARVRSSITDADIAAAGEALLSKSKICFVTMKGSPQQNVLQNDLYLLGKEVSFYSATQHQEEAGTLADEDTAMLFIKMNISEPTNLIRLAKRAKARGALTLFISNGIPVNEREICDFSLQFDGATCHSDMYGLDLILQALVQYVRDH
ncbi:hypothetical protein LJC32_05845, partial [Oscillospiraceae bacterium OttesenSCG-928-F05]|nr:hypothetical protein [Oscillospiraceae bacterium OttesenSCG-928-F05]